MGRLGRIGLQKRIFLYVAVGLALMLGIFAYLGLRAIRHSTDLVFQERLGLARELAAGLSRSFEHVAEDIKEDLAGISSADDKISLQKNVQLAFYHVAEVDKFPLFKVDGLWLITPANSVVAGSSAPLPFDKSWITSHLKEDLSISVLSPQSPEARGFVFILIPLLDRKKDVWSMAFVSTIASSSVKPLTPAGFLKPDNEEDEPPKRSQYILEIVNPEDMVLLNIGSGEPAGKLSSHLPLIRALRKNRDSDVTLHRMNSESGEKDHVVAMVPVPQSDLYLAMEQEEDIALALPKELLRQLLLFGGAGFLITLFTAWVTTRSVVKPTKALIHASERLARGELAAPVSVHADDEIGRLAENMEAMRQRLNSALLDLERANRELEDRVHDRTQRLSEALEKIISAQEEERRRLARELHDETAQALVTLSIILDAIRDKSLIDPPAAREQALKAKELASNLLEETRRLIFNLRPSVLDDFGLVSALRWYAEHYLEERGIEVAFKADSPVISSHIQVAMFRIAQEAISNIAKHSQAKHARIEVYSNSQSVILRVEDDGRGFNLSDNWIHDASKVGLVGMRERANLLGARLEIISSPGNGTRIYLEVPGETNNE